MLEHSKQRHTRPYQSTDHSSTLLTSSLMAFVHPSRMALVPKDSASSRPSGNRLSSPPHPQISSANRERDRSLDRYPRRNGDEEYSNGRRRDRGRSSDRDESRDRGRRQSRHRSNGDRHNDRRDESVEDRGSRGGRAQRHDRPSVRSPRSSSRSPLGRASPQYDDYTRRDSPPPPPSHDDSSRRPDIPPENDAPWRQQENMYRKDGRFDGGGDYFER
jgi:hypothetical protein